MTDSFEPDRPVICPYDNKHRIASSRLQRHLVKCARNFPPDYKISCPYNATHRLFKSELQEHISICEDHQHVDSIIYETYAKRGADMLGVASERPSVIDRQESWDEDDDNFYPVAQPPNCQFATPLDAVRRNNVEINASTVPAHPLFARQNRRAPRGFAEALMMEDSGESVIDETGSVVSYMGVGRGRPWNEPRDEIIMKIGRGRGSGQPKM